MSAFERWGLSIGIDDVDVVELLPTVVDVADFGIDAAMVDCAVFTNFSLYSLFTRSSASDSESLSYFFTIYFVFYLIERT